MSATQQTQPTPPSRPGVLVRCGLLSPTGGVIGAEKHPDADLMELIDRYTDLKTKRERAWDKARKYDQRGPRYKKLSDEAFSFRDELDRLEGQINKSPAKTVIGAVAKISMVMADIDPMGEGISKQGTMFQLALSALTDAKRVLDAEP